MNNDDFIDKISLFFKKHLGKMGIILGLGGAISSSLVSLGFPLVAGITLAFTNIGIFIGGLAYDRLHTENIKLNDDISEKKEYIRKMTIIPTSFHFPQSDTISNVSTTTHYDTPLNLIDLINKNSITPNAINIENAPDTT
jgi:hypothetical protein